MATLDKKISQFTAATTLSDTSQAFLAVVDETEVVQSDRNKKMTVDNFKTALNIQGGMTANERANQNNLIKDVARLNYANSLNAIAYKGGFYDIFADSAKIGNLVTPAIEYDIANATYDSVSLSVTAQDASPLGITFNSNGTKMFIVGYTNSTVYQYSCPTAGTIVGATYDSVSLSVATQDTQPFSITFNSDGSKMFMVGITNKTVYQYSCPTAGTIAGATYDSVSFSVAAQDASPESITFNSDGSKMFIVGYTNSTVYQYSCPTAGTIAGVTYDSISLSVSAQDSSSSDISFNSNGTKMFIVGRVNDTVYQYSCPTAGTIVGATYDSVSLSVATQDTQPRGITFNSNGTKLFMLGDANNTVYQYTTETPEVVTKNKTNVTVSTLDNADPNGKVQLSIETGSDYYTSGNFVTTSIDLTADLSEAPNQVVVSSEFATPTDTTLSVTISDGTNTVTVTSANFDTEVDCSALTSRTLTATWNLGTSNTASTPTITNYALYFTT